MSEPFEYISEWTPYLDGQRPSVGKYYVKMSGPGDVIPMSVIEEYGERYWSEKGFEEVLRDKAIRGTRIIAWKPMGASVCPACLCERQGKSGRTRREAIVFLAQQLKNDSVCTRKKGQQSHYGRQELREFLDFLYGGPPEDGEQSLPPSELHAFLSKT